MSSLSCLSTPEPAAANSATDEVQAPSGSGDLAEMLTLMRQVVTRVDKLDPKPPRETLAASQGPRAASGHDSAPSTPPFHGGDGRDAVQEIGSLGSTDRCIAAG